jgi:hypothetical protein
MILEAPFGDDTRPVRDEGVIISALLTLAAIGMPYRYYEFMRWAVFILALIFAYEMRKKPLALFGIIAAILFNPLSPIILSRSSWQIIDIMAAILFAYLAFNVRNLPEISDEPLIYGNLDAIKSTNLRCPRCGGGLKRQIQTIDGRMISLLDCAEWPECSDHS